MAVGQTAFPDSVDTDKELLVAVDGLHGQLAQGLAHDATSAVLVNTTGWPSAGLFVCEDEIISYDGISGNTLQNLVRSFTGTRARKAHKAGVVVKQPGLAAFHNVLKDALIAVETAVAGIEGIEGLDADLLAIGALSGAGLLRRTESNTWVIDANPSITPNTYGDADEALTLTVDQQGRITAISSQGIQIGQAAVVGLPAALAALGEADGIGFDSMGLDNTSATDVQTALEDFDAAITAATEGGGGSAALFAIQSSTVSVTSSASLTDLTGLSVTIPGAGTFVYTASLHISAGAGGWRVGWGGTVTLSAARHQLSFTMEQGSVNAGSAVNTTTTGNNIGAEDAAGAYVVTISGVLVATAGGTFKLRAAQNTSNGVATDIYVNNWLKVEQIT